MAGRTIEEVCGGTGPCCTSSGFEVTLGAIRNREENAPVKGHAKLLPAQVGEGMMDF